MALIPKQEHAYIAECSASTDCLPQLSGGRAAVVVGSVVSGATPGVADAPSGILGVTSRALGGVLRTAAYGASIPERLVRSAAAGLGGIVKETAEFALPGMVQRSTLYSIFLDRAMRFIIEGVGQVEGVYAEDDDGEAYLVRKVVGNFIEIAGLMTMSASPLWILALTGDAALGVRTYLDLLVEELKAKGVLERTDSIESASGLLAHLERLSAAGALAIDLPPTQIEEMKQMLGRTRDELRDTAQDASEFVAQADDLLAPMREIARREGVTLFDVSALVGMRAARTVSDVALRSAPFAFAAAGAGIRLVNEQLVEHYRGEIREIRDKGFYAALRASYAPYAGTVLSHFRPGRTTLTDRILSGELFRKMAAGIRRGSRR